MFLHQEERRTKPNDYYLAQIAAEIRRGNAKDAEAVKNKDFIIEFKDKQERQQQDPEVSKRFWMSTLGIN